MNTGHAVLAEPEPSSPGLFTPMRTGNELPKKAALGLSAIGAAAALALLFKEVMAIRQERRAQAGLRRPDLAGQTLGDVMARLMQKQAAEPATSFNGSAPGLFVDAMGNDMAADVAHVFAKAVDAADQMLAAGDATFMQNLLKPARGLEEVPDLSAALANTVSEANGHCHDRLTVNLGQLMMAQALHESRKPDSPPAAVLWDLVQHATTRAASEFVHGLVGPGAEPSAELMLYAYHAVEYSLTAVGIPQRTSSCPPGSWTGTMWCTATRARNVGSAGLDCTRLMACKRAPPAGPVPGHPGARHARLA